MPANWQHDPLLVGRIRASAWDRAKTLMLGTTLGVLAAGLTYLILAGMFE